MNTITSTEYKEVLENTFEPGKTVTKSGWIRSEAAQTMEAVRLACEMFLKQYAQEAAEGREQHPQDYADALRSLANRIESDITSIENQKTKWEAYSIDFFTREEVYDEVWEGIDTRDAVEIAYDRFNECYDMIEDDIREAGLACVWYNTFCRLYYQHRIADAGRKGCYFEADLKYAQLAVDIEKKHRHVLEVIERETKGEN